MAVADEWVPVALSISVEPASSTGVLVDGAELVVWRDDKGVAHVWEDRCPHRGMRMSFGFVRGDRLACLYHGWTYDAAGQCRYIPAHPELDVPATIRVRTYDVAEQAGLIWTRLAEGGDSIIPISSPDTGEPTPVRTLYVSADLASVPATLAQAGLRLPQGDLAATPEIETLGSACWLLSAGPFGIYVAGQQVARNQIALHILLAGMASPAERRAVARWAEGLRLMLENPAHAGATLEYA